MTAKNDCRHVQTHLIPSCDYDFDGYVEGLRQRFYAGNGRPGLPPGCDFRMLLMGYFEALDAERAIAWRARSALSRRSSRDP